MLVQNQQFSARVRRVIGGRWSRWSFRAGVRRGIKLLPKERRNVVNEESGYENSGKKILCCRNASAFGKFILLHSSFASSRTGVSHTETVVLSPKQPVAKRQLCILARPKSPPILSWSTELRFCQKEVQESQWYPVYFHKKMCWLVKCLEGDNWNLYAVMSIGHQRQRHCNKCRVKLASKI